MAEKMRSSEVSNSAGKVATLWAAAFLAVTSFADKANAHVQGVCPPWAEFGIRFIPKVPWVPWDNELHVGPDGEPCAAFTAEEMQEIQRQNRDSDSDIFENPAPAHETPVNGWNNWNNWNNGPLNPGDWEA